MMAEYIEAECIEQAILHITRYGDTDIFPHLIELAFLSEKRRKWWELFPLMM